MCKLILSSFYRATKAITGAPDAWIPLFQLTTKATTSKYYELECEGYICNIQTLRATFKRWQPQDWVGTMNG